MRAHVHVVLVLMSTLNFIAAFPFFDTNSTKQCPAERLNGPAKISFNSTSWGSIAFPRELCLDEYDAPLFRRCYRNGTWEDFSNVKCIHNQSSIADTASIEKLPSDKFKPVDVLMVIEYLRKVESEAQGAIEKLEKLLSLDLQVFDRAMYLWDLIFWSMPNFMIEAMQSSKEDQPITRLNHSLSRAALLPKHGETIITNNLTHLNEDLDFEIAIDFSENYWEHDRISIIAIDHPYGGYYVGPKEQTLDADTTNVTIYFKTKQEIKHPVCVHWKYSDNIEVLNGEWIKVSEASLIESISPSTHKLYKCETLTFGWMNVISEERLRNWNKYCPVDKINGVTFPHTNPGVSVLPLEFCLLENKLPAERKCYRNGSWAQPPGKCYDSDNFSNITKQLVYAAYKMEPTEALQVLETLTTTNTFEFTPIDVNLSSTILAHGNKRISPEGFAKTINNIMNVPLDVLKESQKLYNSTDKILNEIDRSGLLYTEDKIPSFENIIVPPTIESENVGTIFINRNVKFVNESESQFEKTMTKIQFDVALRTGDKSIKTALFPHRQLFNPGSEDQRPSSSILKMSSNSSGTTTIYFRQRLLGRSATCAEYVYGYSGNQPIKSRWLSLHKAIPVKKNIFKCKISRPAKKHTAHFALLMTPEVAVESAALEAFTFIGCLLSTIGVISIYLTACCFRIWTQNPRNQLVLHIATCQLLMTVLFYLSTLIETGIWCIVVGVALHYVVLAYFTWTLVMAICYYNALVKVFGETVEERLWKYVTFGWLCPAVIVLITAAMYYKKYDKSFESQICYPKETIFTYGVLVPLGLVLVCNLVVFGVIIRKSYFQTSTSHFIGSRNISPKIAIIIFTMMGLMWIFGIIGKWLSILLYPFCFLATMQGFAMMIFYIVDAEKTKRLWKGKFHKDNERLLRDSEIFVLEE